jgi:3-mercaptopyruvate sulfurtransferase SseA
MKSRSSVIYVVFLGMLVLGSMAALAQEPGMEEMEGVKHEFPTITCEELKALIDSGKTDDIVIVDNAPKEAYDEEGHIPGAVSFPWVNQVKPPITLPRNKTLIMYCPCAAEEDSTDMANKLRSFGYFKIKLLKGGWFKWEELKYPIEKTAAK